MSAVAQKPREIDCRSPELCLLGRVQKNWGVPSWEFPYLENQHPLYAPRATRSKPALKTPTFSFSE